MNFTIKIVSRNLIVLNMTRVCLELVYWILISPLYDFFQESSISILRGVGDEEDDEDLEVGDILNDEEIDTILEDSDDDTDR